MEYSKTIENPKETLRINNDIILKEGEIINVYGEPYVGKTTFCFYVVKNNSEKRALYVAAEELDNHYKKVLNEISPNIFMSGSKNLDTINRFCDSLKADYIIIDSITALQYIEDKKLIDAFLDIITANKMNAIIVSQAKNYDEKLSYGHNKIIDFRGYKIKVEKKDNKIVLGNKYEIDFEEIWNNKERR